MGGDTWVQVDREAGGKGEQGDGGDMGGRGM